MRELVYLSPRGCLSMFTSCQRLRFPRTHWKLSKNKKKRKKEQRRNEKSKNLLSGGKEHESRIPVETRGSFVERSTRVRSIRTCMRGERMARGAVRYGIGWLTEWRVSCAAVVGPICTYVCVCGVCSFIRFHPQRRFKDRSNSQYLIVYRETGRPLAASPFVYRARWASKPRALNTSPRQGPWGHSQREKSLDISIVRRSVAACRWLLAW